jgi:hypothetical protein
MSHYHTNGVRRLQNYAEAQHKLMNTKPIRSQQSGGRIPLGHRRYHMRASIAAQDNNIVLSDYEHPFVVWSPDNTFIVNPPKYKSAFMCDDLSAFLPFGLRVLWDKGRYVIAFIEDDGWKRYFLDNTLRFKPRAIPNKHCSYELAESPTAYHVRLRPKKYQPMLDKYQPFEEWFGLVETIDNKDGDYDNFVWRDALADATVKLRGAMGIPADPKWWENLHAKAVGSPEGAEREMMWADYRNRDDIPRTKGRDGLKYNSNAVAVVLGWLADTTGENWVTARTIVQRHAGNYLWRQHRFHASPKQVADFIKDLVLHHHRDKVFELVPTADGEVPTTRNQEYFRTFTFSMEKPSA